MADTETTTEPEAPDTTERLKAKQPSRRKRRARKKFNRARHCRLCADKMAPDYKDPRGLRAFLTDEGKILPRRVTGSCARHQRGIALAVKRARAIALLPTSAAELY